MRQIEQTLIADEELHDLKLRLELLEGDRKAYYETSQWAIRQNKDEIATLRLNVKEMAERVSRLKKSENDPRSSRLSLAKVERFGQKICEVHKRYDDLQADMRNKQDKLQEKMDRLYGLQKESQMMKVEVEDSDNAYEIRNLENRLDRALIKYNEAQSIRKTYEQIVQQLQDERLSFDNQLATFERTLKAKKQDSTELDLMSSDANHARDMAKTELARIDAQILQEREIRSRELQIRKESVKIKMEEREAALLKNVETHETGLDSLKSDEPDGAVDEDREKRVSEFDEILRTVKEVMGVSKLDEVVEKFKSQAETGSHLTSLQTANESRAEALKIRYAEILVEDEKVRFNGESRQTSARRMIEDLERHLSEATIRAQESKNRYEKVAGILRNAKAGVQHSIDKLDGITLDDVPSNLKSADDNFPYILNVATQKLELLHCNVTSRERPVTGSAPVSATTELGSESQQEESGALAAGAISPAISAIEKPITTLLGGPSPIVTVGQAMLPAHNCRVKLRPVEFDERSDGEEEEDVGDEHVPSREMLKKHTTQLLNSKMKKPAKKARKKAKAEKSDGDD